jgi:hypothetical protein
VPFGASDHKARHKSCLGRDPPWHCHLPAAQANVLTGIGQRPGGSEAAPANASPANQHTKAQQQAHAVHRKTAAVAAPAPKKRQWSKAQKAVQASVMRAMAMQKREEESDAQVPSFLPTPSPRNFFSALLLSSLKLGDALVPSQ